MSKDLQVPNMNQLQTAPTLPAAMAAPASAAVDPVPEIDALEHRAWRAFLTRHARVARQLEADLLARSDLPLAEFDVLFQLGEADGGRLRMNELADRVLLSRAGITRLVDRLVADGLVGRAKCASDARGAFAVLTDQGRLRLQAARPGHFDAVRRYFLKSFTRAELETLAELMERTAAID
ncbi:MAG: MarR family winged helix-turn-helix transcriptional regulator [Candidatus Limnocylindrales bacterium]